MRNDRKPGFQMNSCRRGSLIFGECREEIERDVYLPTPSRHIDPPHNHYFDETIKNMYT